MKRCMGTAKRKIESVKERKRMKVLVTGVAGQLGHDVMNELAERGLEGIGSDIAPEYSGDGGWNSCDFDALYPAGYHR